MLGFVVDRRRSHGRGRGGLGSTFLMSWRGSSEGTRGRTRSRASEPRRLGCATALRAWARRGPRRGHPTRLVGRSRSCLRSARPVPDGGTTATGLVGGRDVAGRREAGEGELGRRNQLGRPPVGAPDRGAGGGGRSSRRSEHGRRRRVGGPAGRAALREDQAAGPRCPRAGRYEQAYRNTACSTA
jgi:hypothetical protein